MKLLSPTLAAMTVSLLAAPPTLAMDQRQADAFCAAWKVECPEGTSATSSGPGKGSGTLECKLKGRSAKEGPSVTCKGGKALAWGDWKAGKKEGLQVTMRPDSSWTEERFADGKQEGRSVEYSAEGQLLKEIFFQAGKKHGTARTFKEDGRLASEEYWNQGVKGKKPAPTPASPAPEGEDQAPAPAEDTAASAPQQ